jgi:amino acid permease
MTDPTPKNAPTWVTALLLLAAVVLAVIAVVYFVKTADGLPGFFPGHQRGSTQHHVKHGIAAAVLAVLALVGAWFATGRRTATR